MRKKVGYTVKKFEKFHLWVSDPVPGFLRTNLTFKKSFEKFPSLGKGVTVRVITVIGSHKLYQMISWSLRSVFHNYAYCNMPSKCAESTLLVKNETSRAFEKPFFDTPNWILAFMRDIRNILKKYPHTPFP